MKHYIIYLLFLTALVSASCSKQLDTEPTQSVDETVALSTSKDVLVALVGCYADLGSSDLYGGRAFVCPDLLASTDNIAWTGTYQGMTQIVNKEIPVDNTFTAQTWLDGYRTINDVNNVLSALGVVDADKKNTVEGEGKFIRGSIYFDLVRLFAKAWNDGDANTNAGVPIVLEPTRNITEESKVPRATVAAVYQQVIQDLSDALVKLPESNGFYANKAAAAAMLSRVYLQQGNYAAALQAADDALAYADEIGLKLNSTYDKAFPAGTQPVKNTSEDVFAMQVTTSSGSNNFQQFYSVNGRGDIAISNAYLATYEDNDDRFDLFYADAGSNFCGKFENQYGNVHIIRLAELYLTRAEANFRLGSSTGETPLDDINTIRKRAGLKNLNTGNLTLDAILLERKHELDFEGFALHDVKRLEGMVGLLSWDDPKLVYPIPLRELRVNPNLTQNDGY